MNVDELKRRDGENERQYLWRIGTQIESGAAGMTWDDVTPYINAEWRTDEYDYRTSCAYRKPVQSALAFYKDVFSKEQYCAEAERMENLKEQIQQERYKLQATKLEQSRELRSRSRIELFYENIGKQIGELEVPEMFPLKCDSGNRQWVLGIGDMHYGAFFDAEHNSYSREEAANRLSVLFGQVVEQIQKNSISKLIVVNVADTVQGILRLRDLQVNDIPVVRAVVEVSKLIAAFLNKLSAYAEIDYYHVPCANHSQTRPLGSKASEIATEDVEFIIANYIKDVLARNNRVRVISNLDKDYVTFKIFDFNILALHGHQIKNLKSALANYTAFHRCFYDYLIMGHYHAVEEKTVGVGEAWNTEVLVCPSFMGNDHYADSLLVASQPMARMYEFDEKRGHVSSVNIFLA